MSYRFFRKLRFVAWYPGWNGLVLSLNARDEMMLEWLAAQSSTEERHQRPSTGCNRGSAERFADML